jgi:spore coat polysaccharide biosynthesis predicted glycosyltransferase SpsG
VLDGYSFDTEYQKQIKAKRCKLVCIDDMHDKEFYADLIINHAPGIVPGDYKAQIYTQFALGLDYVLLRPSFLEQAKNERIFEKIETLLICFGGSDFKNLTLNNLKVALEFKEFKKIIVVTGAAYKISDDFIQLTQSDKRIDHRSNLDEKKILDAMLESELAIVPASGILFEVLASGCYVITGTYIDNQQNILKGFVALNAIKETKNLLNPQYELLNFFQNRIPQKQKYIDGNSKKRIIEKFRSL